MSACKVIRMAKAIVWREGDGSWRGDVPTTCLTCKALDLGYGEFDSWRDAIDNVTTEAKRLDERQETNGWDT